MVRRSARERTWARRAGAVVLAALFLCRIASAQAAQPVSANTGKRVAEVYLSDSHASVPRPEKEWKGFAKMNLRPGESTQVTMMLDPRAFSF
jgi:hypothetical protein